ncbi:MAG: hypothetical protein H6667_13235 [Ardenticatenaceae bacterium]|nr:hypothetical protein [Ardenticatenaceae bacterium]MCB9442708.1 hypothetical protein [Ardenticatenaceae bacterium]
MSDLRPIPFNGPSAHLPLYCNLVDFNWLIGNISYPSADVVSYSQLDGAKIASAGFTLNLSRSQVKTPVFFENHSYFGVGSCRGWLMAVLQHNTLRIG